MSSSPAVPLIAKDHWLLGSVPTFRHRPIKALMRYMANYGDIYQLRIPFRPIVVIHNADAIKYVLVTNNKNYRKDFATRQLSLGLGNGLLTSEGDFWRRQRRIAQPAFHRQRIAQMGQQMIRETQAMLLRWEQFEGTFDLAQEMMVLTSNIASEALFGTGVENNEEIGDALLVAMRFITHTFRSVIPPPLWLPTRHNREFKKAISAMDDRIHGMIQDRLKHPEEERHDLLTMLLEAKDEETGERMTEQQLRDEIITIFSAGHETSANGLTWLFYLLDQHPEIRDRLEAEVDQVLQGRPIQVSDLPQLPYTLRVIQESMRLYPPAWAIGREALEDDEILGYRIPKGTNVLLPPYVLHRNPSYWEEPERFDPDRFLPEASKHRHRHAYLPFGGGPRFCIGNNFALMEMQLAVASVVQRFRLKHDPSHEVDLDALITLRPRYGMRMRVEKREGKVS